VSISMALIYSVPESDPRVKCYDPLNSRELPDEDMTKSKGKDPLEGLGGPMTRAIARKAKEALQQVLSILFEYKPKFQGEKSKVVSCIMAQMED